MKLELECKIKPSTGRTNKKEWDKKVRHSMNSKSNPRFSEMPANMGPEAAGCWLLKPDCVSACV